MKKLFIKLFDSNRRFCRYDGEPLEYPKDDPSHLHHVATGEREKTRATVRTKDIQFCIKHDFYTHKTENGWKDSYDGIISILHLIA